MAEQRDSSGERRASLYLLAEHDARPLLGSNWHVLDRPQESRGQKQLYPTRPDFRRLWQAQAQLTLTYRKETPGFSKGK